MMSRRTSSAPRRNRPLGADHAPHHGQSNPNRHQPSPTRQNYSPRQGQPTSQRLNPDELKGYKTWLTREIKDSEHDSQWIGKEVAMLRAQNDSLFDYLSAHERERLIRKRQGKEHARAIEPKARPYQLPVRTETPPTPVKQTWRPDPTEYGSPTRTHAVGTPQPHYQPPPHDSPPRVQQPAPVFQPPPVPVYQPASPQQFSRSSTSSSSSSLSSSKSARFSDEEY